MPENKEIPNQNTLFSSSSQSHSPPKPAEPSKGPDAKTPPAADGKKPVEPSKAPDAKVAPAADSKKPAEPAKGPDTKTPPTTDAKKPTEPPKAPDTKTTPTADTKKPTEPAKAPDTKAAPEADAKKPTEPAKAPDAKAPPAADAKKPTEPPKGPDAKAAPTADAKKPAEPAKAPDTKAPPAADGKNPAEQSKIPDTKTTPAAVPPKTAEAAKDPVKGVKITQIFADRLEKPDEKALKDLPIPQEGEGFSIRLHPDYFFDFLDHPFTVNREVDDYKELFDSIKANGINEPVKARPREGGGLELISGHRRHDIAKQLNYPVPVIIEQVDTNDAQIECVDGNLHRQDIPTSELARAAKMKMEALARKAGRRSKMDQLTGPSKRTDQIVAEDMGMSRNQVNRLVRIDSLVPELKKRVDDKKLAFNTAVELSYLKPEEQGKVADFIEDSGHSPTLEQATQLKEASRAAQEAEKAAAKAPPAKAPSTPQAPAQKAPAQGEEKAPAPLDTKKIASIVKEKPEPEQKYIFTSTELKEYFPNVRLPTTSEVKRKVFDALDLQKKVQERQQAKQALKDSMKTPAR
ncbi:ParB/RepB/Spo0J family partition protein [Oscillibacter valericigenes]|uniref:ParB/RepB/Spo0J family partition protein n=1 Tax=Oscillibacter valericigenes TaxID=351091 RepID=UPI0019569CBB|nr:ParB N-terminal domain-containing protein [Oscillibacter valericigenes]MBM6909109.1 ParB N-terminal domain-containing protein [Oscillibacter valericigenes]